MTNVTPSWNDVVARATNPIRRSTKERDGFKKFECIYRRAIGRIIHYGTVVLRIGTGERLMLSTELTTLLKKCRERVDSNPDACSGEYAYLIVFLKYAASTYGKRFVLTFNRLVGLQKLARGGMKDYPDNGHLAAVRKMRNFKNRRDHREAGLSGIPKWEKANQPWRKSEPNTILNK